MDREEVRAAVENELREALDRDELALPDSAVAGDVPGWDSLVNLKLLVGLERACKVKFRLSEMSEAQNVGELIDMILAKRSA